MKIMSLFSFLVFIVVCSVSPGFGAPPVSFAEKKSPQQIYLAKVEVEKINHSGAIAEYKRAIDLLPCYSANHYRAPSWSIVRYKNGAILEFHKPSKSTPDNQQARDFNGANATQKSLEGFTNAIKLDPNLQPAYYERSLLLFERGNTVGALRDCEMAIALSPKDADAFLRRAYVRGQTSDNSGAVHDCNRAIAIDPSNSNGYFSRAVYESKLGRTFDARKDLTEAIRLDPLDAAAYNFRSTLYVTAFEGSDAISDSNRAVELEPKNTDFLSDRARIKAELLNFPGAFKDLDRAIALEPSNSSLYVSRAWTRWRSSHDAVRAIYDFNVAIELGNSAIQEVFLCRGSMRSYLGDYAGAIEDYNSALNVDPYFYSYTYRLRAKCRYRSGDLVGAVIDYFLYEMVEAKQAFKSKFPELSDYISHLDSD